MSSVQLCGRKWGTCGQKGAHAHRRPDENVHSKDIWLPSDAAAKQQLRSIGGGPAVVLSIGAEFWASFYLSSVRLSSLVINDSWPIKNMG